MNPTPFKRKSRKELEKKMVATSQSITTPGLPGLNRSLNFDNSHSYVFLVNYVYIKLKLFFSQHYNRWLPRKSMPQAEVAII